MPFFINERRRDSWQRRSAHTIHSYHEGVRIMFCVYCGKQVPDDNQFCTGCGKPLHKNAAEAAAAMRPGSTVSMDSQTSAPVPVKVPGQETGSCENTSAATAPVYQAAEEAAPVKPAKAPRVKKEKTKKSKFKAVLFVILGVIVVALIAAAVIVVLRITDPVNKFTDSMEKGNYDAAAALYDDSIAGNEEKQKKADEYINGIINDTTAGFDSKTLSYDEAKSKLDTIDGMGISDDSLIKEAYDHIDALNTSRTAFATAEELLAKKDYPGAVGKYRLVIKTDSNYETAQKQITAALDAYRKDTLAKAEELAAEDNYEEALTVLNSGLKVLPDDSEIVKKIDLIKSDRLTYVKDTALASAETSVSSGDYAGAFAALDKALGELPNDADLINARTNYENKYVADVLSQAVTAFGAEKNYKGAIDLISAALAVLPSNKALSDAKKDYESYTPVYLTSMDYFDYKGTLCIDDFDTVQDNFGTAYTHSLYCHDGYVTYLLNGSYSTLSLIVAVPYDERASYTHGDLRIYADDKLVYSSGTMTSGSAVQPVVLDVTGVQQLKMTWYYESFELDYSSSMATAWDAYVQR